jgi:protein-tyrosine phosphatase
MAGSQRVTFEAHRFAPAAPDEEYVYGACCPGWHSTAADKVRHVSVADHHLADETTLRNRILPFLSTAVQRREPVVVHCLAGIGRTGHVLAAWLVAGRDYDPVEAIQTVQRLGRSPAEAVTSGNARRGDLFQLLSAFD